MTTLLDLHMPRYSRRVGHATFVRAHHEAVANTIERVQLTQSPVLRTLLERCVVVRPSVSSDGGMRVAELNELGFAIFRSVRGDEVAVGAMWIPTARGLERITATSQVFGASPACATRILIHLGVRGAGAARSIVRIEARLDTADSAGTAQALAHWDAFHQLGAAARRDVLLAIKHGAETARRPAWD